MSRRTEDWPLSRNGERKVDGWDDGAEPPDRPCLGFVLGVLLGASAWIVVAVVLRSCGVI